jgi:ATP-dependent DNA ligase
MPTKKKRTTTPGVRSDARHQSPGFIVPMAALAVDALPEGPEWSYELKMDGYRALIIKDSGSLQIRSRNDKDLLPMRPDTRD